MKLIRIKESPEEGVTRFYYELKITDGNLVIFKEEIDIVYPGHFSPLHDACDGLRRCGLVLVVIILKLF